MGCPKNALAQWLTGVAGSRICAPPAGAGTPARDLIHRIGCNDAMNDPSLAYQSAPVPCRCFNNGAPKMSGMKFHVGDRVEDKKTHERGRVTFVYSTLELRDRPPRGSKYRHAGRARARSLQRDLKLTNCAPNSCVVFPYKDAWMRKTQNGGSRGSICYAMFKNLDDALSAGVGWAWRKDRESR